MAFAHYIQTCDKKYLSDKAWEDTEINGAKYRIHIDYISKVSEYFKIYYANRDKFGSEKGHIIPKVSDFTLTIGIQGLYETPYALKKYTLEDMTNLYDLYKFLIADKYAKKLLKYMRKYIVKHTLKYFDKPPNFEDEYCRKLFGIYYQSSSCVSFKNKIIVKLDDKEYMKEHMKDYEKFILSVMNECERRNLSFCKDSGTYVDKITYLAVKCIKEKNTKLFVELFVTDDTFLDMNKLMQLLGKWLQLPHTSDKIFKDDILTEIYLSHYAGSDQELGRSLSEKERKYYKNLLLIKE